MLHPPPAIAANDDVASRAVLGQKTRPSPTDTPLRPTAAADSHGPIEKQKLLSDIISDIDFLLQPYQIRNERNYHQPKSTDITGRSDTYTAYLCGIELSCERVNNQE